MAEKGVEIPIIFITGHGTVPMSVKAMKAGAVDFLQKPFEDQELLDAAQRSIELDRQKRKEKKERRRQIQSAAKAMFTEKGYSKTTMEDIAQRAELSPGTLYLYFKNKASVSP